MQNRIRSEACRVTVVCVDSAEDGLLTGRLYNPYLSAGVEFKNLMQFLLTMETLLDKLQLPQSFNAKRSFEHPEEPLVTLADSGPQRGKAATFSARVIFRQNASWQGCVTWLEGEKEESFRSVLELVLLMYSATGDENNRKKAKSGTRFSALQTKQKIPCDPSA